jgi:hypothetical protein
MKNVGEQGARARDSMRAQRLIQSNKHRLQREFIMAKKSTRRQTTTTGRSQRVKLSAEESLKRVREFAQRKEAFIAAVRKGKNRGVSP